MEKFASLTSPDQLIYDFGHLQIGSPQAHYLGMLSHLSTREPKWHLNRIERLKRDTRIAHRRAQKK